MGGLLSLRLRGNKLPPNKALHRTPAAAPLSPVSFRTLGGPKHYLISRSPGQHVRQAGRGEQRAEVSREDRLPTR
jgi:hypothetical protein